MRDIYRDMAERTGGDIYIAVAGPVRTGKSTFIKRFSELLLLPNMENEYETIEREVKITPRNTLIINLSFFYSAGGYSNVSNSYTFRMQQGDFYLIGEDVCELSRLTGDMRTESFNYLTHKKQTLEENAFDEKVKAKETWQNIAKEPLKRLGETELQ